MNKLAIDGGTPARSKPLPPNYPGAVFMGPEEEAKVAEVVRSQSPFRYYGIDMQDNVKQLEEQMAGKLAIPYTLGVTSGTAALVIALRAAGVGYGDKVIVPANTFVATPGAVICCNAVPIFVDVDDTLNIDAADLERVMDDEVKAIIAVPIIGTPCDMDPIMAFARKHNIAVIEDVAQSCGVKYKGRYQGTIGDVGAFSFQMNKIITAGEGGAVVTNDVGYFERAVRYHDQGVFRDKARYGIDSSEELNAFAGQNYRMSEVTGSVMLEQWAKLDAIVGNMRTSFDRIRDAVAAELPSIVFRRSPDDAGDIGSNLGFILPDADSAGRFNAALNAELISSYTLYGGKPVYKHPSIWNQRTIEKDNFPFNFPFKNPVVYKDGLCPSAENLIPRAVFIPISPVLTEKDEEEIIAGVIKVYKGLNIEAIQHASVR
ncbi:MAG: aminotransferase DegT [Paenibacillus sp.]|jgi:8-amino-3,8-dideoxy-alpha-D-manno-octulosonate transaminase|nr:aminotransferase DegT [Paenibacillus sp.]